MTGTRLARWQAARHARLGKAIWRGAQDDYRRGTLQRRTGGLMVANALALAVLLIPVVTFLAGLWFLWAFWPAVLGLLFGALLIVFAVYLLPRRPKPPDGILRRSDLPQTFAMLDGICAQLKTAPITGVVFEEGFNAAVTQIGAERLLFVGAVMWEALTPDERLALLGHEMAHMVNADPARRGLIAKALRVTQAYLHMLSPQGAPNIWAEIILAPFALLAEGVFNILMRLLYMESQRAEYLADALGAEISGREAAICLLEKTALVGLLTQSENAMGTGPAQDPGTVLARLAKAISHPAAHDRARAMETMQKALLAVDQTHPPTAYRIAFLQGLPATQTQVLDVSGFFSPMAKEWAPHMARQAERIAAGFDVQ